MAGVATFTKSGTKSTSAATLKKDIFACVVANHELLKLAYLSHQGEKRANLAKTKRRGEVRGSTIKPWRQKGLGRARFGSRYNPIWRGGGITFGPLGNENYKKTINKRSKRTALKQALTLANQDNKISVIETFECKEGKVNTTKKLLDKIGAKGKTLLVVSQKDQLVDRATGNLPEVKAVQAQYLTVYDVLNADSIIISKKSLDIISEWLGDKK
jgi:large subunit ribosomal protein L4